MNEIYHLPWDLQHHCWTKNSPKIHLFKTLSQFSPATDLEAVGSTKGGFGENGFLLPHILGCYPPESVKHLVPVSVSLVESECPGTLMIMIWHQVFIGLPSRQETLLEPCENSGKSHRWCHLHTSCQIIVINDYFQLHSLKERETQIVTCWAAPTAAKNN